MHKKIKGGYFKVFNPTHKYSKTKKGWIIEHRAVVENFIKRALKSGEQVHHIDSNRKNNNIKNLMIFPSSAKHQSFHTKIRQFGLTSPIKRQIKNRWKNENVGIR